MKISEVIKKLQKYEKAFGDVPVVLSSDSEGNAFGSLDSEMSFCTFEENNAIVLYPFVESCDIDNLLDK